MSLADISASNGNPVNTHFWAWSKFNVFANFDTSKTNDSALKSPHQGGFGLGLLAGGKHNYKKYLFAEGKQTVREGEIIATPGEVFWARSKKASRLLRQAIIARACSFSFCSSQSSTFLRYYF